MSRYIDAEKFIATINSSDELDAYSAITVCELIKNESPADVRENVHGEWIYKNDNILMPTGYWECSVCKEGRLMYEENFCPNCGADMRKGETNG